MNYMLFFCFERRKFHEQYLFTALFTLISQQKSISFRAQDWPWSFSRLLCSFRSSRLWIQHPVLVKELVSIHTSAWCLWQDVTDPSQWNEKLWMMGCSGIWSNDLLVDRKGSSVCNDELAKERLKGVSRDFWLWWAVDMTQTQLFTLLRITKL